MTAHVLAASVIPARAQMGATLGFHIIFACFGIAMPAIVLLAHWRGLRHGDAVSLLLARRWSKVMAVLFAVGAVSGTVLSYELGLLWPKLMGIFGPAFGIPFSVEAIWFFVEAIFTAIYLYGWRRLPAWLHWWTGVPLVVSGVLGAFSVVAANAWMNQPSGFTLSHGRITHVDPWAVIFNKATPYEVPHMILAAYMVAGFRSPASTPWGCCAGAATATTASASSIPSPPPRCARPSRSSSATSSPAPSKRSSRRSSPPWNWSAAPTPVSPNGSAASTGTARSTSASAFPTSTPCSSGTPRTRRSSAGTPCRPACAPRCPT